VEIDKYTKNKNTKNKFCTKLALFTRLYRDTQSTKHKNKKTSTHPVYKHNLYTERVSLDHSVNGPI